MIILGSCKHPLKGFPIGFTENGKPKYKITSFEADHVEVFNNGTVDVSMIPLRSAHAVKCVREFVTIPCGRCIGCRLQYSRDWANRCMLELQDHDSSYFVTLTYDDNHVPVNECLDPETGEILRVGTLVKRDWQNFMKRLRKAFPEDSLRFFMCGEYGDHTYRPHYHAIIYGLHLDDLEVYKKSELGDILYNSKTIDKIWKKGYCVIGEVTWNSCAYVARYVTKKKYGKEGEFYEKYNIVPEFVLMSRKPGIARSYYDENKELIFDSDFIYLCTEDGSRQIAPSKYFKKLFEIDNPEEYERLKLDNRQFAEDFEKMRLESTSKSYLEMLETEESVLLSKTKSLFRNEV